jgi:hypothetical protein
MVRTFQFPLATVSAKSILTIRSIKAEHGEYYSARVAEAGGDK